MLLKSLNLGKSGNNNLEWLSYHSEIYGLIHRKTSFKKLTAISFPSHSTEEMTGYFCFKEISLIKGAVIKDKLNIHKIIGIKKIS